MTVGEDKNLTILFARLDDLYRNADRGILGSTSFLSPRDLHFAQIHLLARGLAPRTRAWGGYADAERKRIYILPEFMEGAECGEFAEYGFEDVRTIDAPAKFFYLAYLLLLEKMDRADAEYGTEAARTLDFMQKKGYKTVVDCVRDAPEKFRAVVMPALPYIDILIVNEIECASCSGIELRKSDGTMNYANLPAAVDFLLANGVRETAVIHFPEGAAGKQKNGEFIYRPSCDIAKADIVGSTGAGDAFAAGVIYALHQEWDLASAMELGGASSNFNLRSATATGGAVSLEKMQEFLKGCNYTEIPAEFAGK